MEENKELQNQTPEMNSKNSVKDENTSTVNETGAIEKPTEQLNKDVTVKETVVDETIVNSNESDDSVKKNPENTADPDDEELSKRLIDSDSSQNDDDDDDDEEEEFNESALAELSREDLLNELNDAIKVDDVFRINNKVMRIKMAFDNKTKEQKQHDYAAFVKKAEEGAKYVDKKDEIENQFYQVFDVFKKKKVAYRKEQEERKKENLILRQEILEKLRELINSEEPLKKTYHVFKDIQEQWKKAGVIPHGKMSELWNNYHFLVEKFFDKVKISNELRALGLKKNLEKKIDLCEKSEELLLDENIHHAFKVLQKYHNKWREIGPVPLEQNELIWQRFKAVSDEINNRRKKYFDQINANMEENYSAKLALCEKVKQINSEKCDNVKKWLKHTDEMNELFKLWRTIGRVPDEKNDEVWSVFKGEMDNFFNAKKIFFNNLKDQQKENYYKKLDIIKEAELLKDSDDWKGTKQQLINLQKEWKNIGSVPRKYSDKIWKEFRAACDHFFARRDDFFKDVHKNEEANLKEKLTLLEKIKQFTLTDNKDEDIEALKQFQRKWIEIGFVPIKKKEALQNEFMSIIDAHFDKLKVSAMEKKAIDFKQKVSSMIDKPNTSHNINKERNNIINKMSKLQENIKLWENNIGFFADSKKSKFLKIEFERKIEKAKNEYALLKSKLKYLDEEIDY